MKNIWRLTAVGVALTVLFSAAPRPIEASLSDSMTCLTFSSQIALPGLTLPAGTYVFESPLLDQPSIVRVWNGDRSKVLLTTHTHAVDRPRTMKPGEEVTFGEAMRGEAVPIQAWYPAEKQTGHAFIYR